MKNRTPARQGDLQLCQKAQHLPVFSVARLSQATDSDGEHQQSNQNYCNLIYAPEEKSVRREQPGKRIPVNLSGRKEKPEFPTNLKS